ncbi:MAG: GntR family transcriptional regulator [Brevundimonas sp.]|uniref:GntR family transcriptional regulator n=1 Tax=Brevundimonas sp. TaxID=1871086 RepID=UPI0027186A75|nr:GntR family transcriptional regulator [Brevundimonas sp.]MDO9587375.1 GntR family transcriptional regulator [Brevundimonas sp.]
MPRARDPFSLALESIRDRAMRGVYEPGGAVVIIEEARRLKLSTTPVREALAWLCGEGLLERAPRAGYLAPRLDAALLRDRFWVRLLALRTSLELTADLGATTTAEADVAGDRAVRDLFDRLVRATGNRALVETFGRVDAQLRLLGDAEFRVFTDAADESRALVRIETVGSRTQLLTAIEAYHRRRMENAAVLVLEVERRGHRPADGA